MGRITINLLCAEKSFPSRSCSYLYAAAKMTSCRGSLSKSAELKAETWVASVNMV